MNMVVNTIFLEKPEKQRSLIRSPEIILGTHIPYSNQVKYVV